MLNISIVFSNVLYLKKGRKLMSDEVKKQLEIINENLVVLARNQAILYSEISLIKCSLKMQHGTNNVKEKIVQA